MRDSTHGDNGAVHARALLPLILTVLASQALSVPGWADDSSAQNQAAQSAAPAASVQVTTDRPGYAPGDTVSVAVTDLGPGEIMPRGGRVCDSLWPIRLEQQDQTGWSPVPVPQDAICAGVSVAALNPGDSLAKTFVAGPDEGTYRVVFAYDSPGGAYGSLPPVYSDPFTVQS